MRLIAGPISPAWLAPTKPAVAVAQDGPSLASLREPTDPVLAFVRAHELVTGIKDTRGLPKAYQAELAELLVERAEPNLLARGVACHVDRDRLIISTSGKHKLNRFAAGLTRNGYDVTIVYEPSTLIAIGAAAFARGGDMLGIGHKHILELTIDATLAHEAVHLHEKRKVRDGELSPFAIVIGASGGDLLPGLYGGIYAKRFSVEEVRTKARDLRQAVHELERIARAGKHDELSGAWASVLASARQCMKHSLRTNAALSQAMGSLKRTGKADVRAGGKLVEFRVATKRASYPVQVTLAARTSADAVSEAADLMAWSKRVARGHLNLSRLAAAVHDAADRGSCAESFIVASALSDALARRDFQQQAGGAPESYDALVAAFNSLMETHESLSYSSS